MILGFAHLAINSGDPETIVADFEAKGFTMEAFHRGVPNAPEKKPYLSKFQELHDLRILGGEVAIEILWHGDTCSRHPLNAIEGGVPVVRTHLTEAETRFWTQGVGYKKRNDGILNFQSRLPFWQGKLKIVKGQPVRELPLLDMEGPVCIAMYSTNVEKDASKLEALGGTEKSAKFNVNVGNRNLDVGFIRSPGGSILELIKVKQK